MVIWKTMVMIFSPQNGASHILAGNLAMQFTFALPGFLLLSKAESACECGDIFFIPISAIY